jgi:ADP-dependent phosphofructokinase/glucokinase
MLINKDIINIIYSFLDGYKRTDLGSKISVKIKNRNIKINKLELSQIYTNELINIFCISKI